MATFRMQRPAGRNQWALVALFLLALVFTGVFAHRLFGRRPPPPKGEPIRGWMTVNYVAHSYRVPPHVLYIALGLPSSPPAPPDRRPLRKIARMQGRTMDEVRELLMAAIAEAQTNKPPPPPPPKKEPSPGDEQGGAAR